MISESPNLQANFRVAFEEVVNSKESNKLIDTFLEAQAFRSQYIWLGESGKLPGMENRDGVAYAIKSALSTYVPKSTGSIENAEKVPSNQDTPRISSETLNRVLDDKLYLGHFAHSLQHSGVDLEKISVAELRYHISAAFEDYSTRSRLNLSSDPW